MLSSQITAADVAKLCGVTRHKVRSMTRDLPGFSERVGLERVATPYSERDLAVLAVCFELEERYGLRRGTVAHLVDAIGEAFSGPKPLASGAYLHLVPHARTVRYLASWSHVDDGLLFPLDSLVQRIDAYLGRQRTTGSQRQLQLGPVLIGVATIGPTAVAPPKRRRTTSKAEAAR